MINLLEMLKIFLNIAKMLLSISNSRRWQKIKKYIYMKILDFYQHQLLWR